ncbi:mannose-1-phosphate guanylyltransferase/mannose-6-phosphate isomerase [Leptolyngbya valderiana BDU 20041]|nr:mannose-1-phosphate guanylyltransferase/mannose-6-phosphate isomerase [Leptolyngbya valderiana BDU 20041]
MIYPVVLSGGSGTRLWPLSRQTYPKQLIALLGERTLLQETVLRIAGAQGFGKPLIIANNEHRFLIAEQLRAIECPPRAIVLEPAPRNTAPAAAVAAEMLVRRDPDAIMALMPADHVIADTAALRAALQRAAAAAAAGRLVTFGIAPSRPETGYGYIRSGAPLATAPGVHEVAAFVEKPDRATAERYLTDGAFLWNSGIFVMPAAGLLEEMERLQPKIVEAARCALDAARTDVDYLRLDEASFALSPSISIDYAVMERTERAAVVPVDCGWNDVGAWHALWELDAKDAAGNVARGAVRLSAARNSYFRSEDEHLLVGVGVEDLVVVSTKNATLVTTRAQAPEVGKIVRAMAAEGRPETELPPTVYRPWGHYEDLVEGEGFRVKRIVVNPGGRLSMQYHHHRSEHWVVVEGEATVTCGETRSTVYPNQSVYIPKGAKHRLENATDQPLILIEVQCGDYVGEDDIVRLDDVYGRSDLQPAEPKR